MSKAPKSLEEMAAESANPRGGLECPKCGCKHFEIYKTIQGQSVKFRYKACRHCGHKVLTSTQSTERIVREITPTVAVDGDEEMPPLMMFVG
jgi:DNA-directed RNA polymerase subunit RPC12/RpoP